MKSHDLRAVVMLVIRMVVQKQRELIALSTLNVVCNFLITIHCDQHFFSWSSCKLQYIIYFFMNVRSRMYCDPCKSGHAWNDDLGDDDSIRKDDCCWKITNT